MHMPAIDPAFWKGKRVFVTGHTGFKGGWLCLWLQSMQAEVFGLSLAPSGPLSLMNEARLAEGIFSRIGDIRDLDTVRAAMAEARPDIVLHLAAQPLVRLSYSEPVATYATNVMGTVHVLEAARQTPSVRAVVNVTTDKCYENREWVWGYREDEPMGGYDPYSNSKGCSELVTSAYRQSFFQKGSLALASARAGNVIGGGDWALDRLVPDVLRAFERDQPVLIRNPGSTRPWQHVLEPLSGYLTLAEKLHTEGHSWAEGWNFGPRDEDAKPVQWIVEHLVREWGGSASWQVTDSPSLHEANLLKLDISKAKARLAWTPRWDLATALSHIVTWHRGWMAKQDVRALCLSQIEQYCHAA